MLKHVVDGGGEVFVGGQASSAGAVVQHESVIAVLGDLPGIGESLVHRADVREAPAGRDDGNRCVFVARKKEEPAVPG